MPQISIVIPAFNASRFIREAIESVRSQSVTDWELIVVDDCSTDSTRQIVEELARTDGRISLHCRTANSGGALVPRMDGFRRASTNRVIGLDADDLIAPGYLSELLQSAEAGSSMVCTGLSFLNPDGRVESYLPADEIDTGAVHAGRELVIRTLDGWKIGLSGALMNRQDILRTYERFLADGHRTNYPFADELLSRMILADTPSVKFNSMAQYLYRVNPQSVTHAVSETTFSRLEMTKELAEWTRAEFGADSREHILAQKMNFLAIVESMRALPTLADSEAKKRVGRLIERNRGIIDRQRVKTTVSLPYRLAMQSGTKIATMIFQLNNKLMR